MKRALVLAGGGSKGSYEVGVIKALHELDIDYHIVTGTSIGALNGCLLAQNDFDAMKKLWDEMDITKVFAGEFDQSFAFDLDTMLNQSNLALSFFKKFIKEKGADITPLKNIVRQLLNEDKLLKSSIDFGLCAVHYPSLKPLFITKEEMEKEYIFDYLISSASCFPVFPIHSFNEQSFIDGGYFDNLPIDLAFDMGADEVIVVDMNKNITHPYYMNRPRVEYIAPRTCLGGFLDFSRETLDMNERLGYQTAMKYYGHYVGNIYTFMPFQTPLFFHYYKDVLYLERYVRKMLRSSSARSFLDEFLEAHGNQPLKEQDYLYVVLDWLCELLERDVSYVYDFHILKSDLLIAFEKYIDPHFKMVNVKDIIQTFKSLNKKGIVGRMLHEMIYPKDNNLDIEKLLTIFSKEYLMARLLFMIYKEKKA